MTNEKHTLVWKNCLKVIGDIIPPASYTTWFEPIVPLRLCDNVLTIEVPSNFFREYLEEHFLDLMSKSLRRELGAQAKLEYSVRVDSSGASVTMPQQGHQTFKNKTVPFVPSSRGITNPFVIPGLQQLEINPQLNPAYSFDNFIEGACNRLARSAGLSIAANPGKTTFNPLFLYGASGLGKTHLAQAIGIAVKEQSPDKIVLYVNANRFQTQFMDAVNVNNKLTDFMHFYQMIDVLIIDDVHEFAEKQRTQNAFFHIFNHLHQSNKQLILTSDKAPVNLNELEPRLLSRFKWGLSAELSAPDFQTRTAILKAKSYNDGVELSDEIIHYIASRITTNVREIEGTLVSLLAQATLNKKPITMQLVESMTEKLVSVHQLEVSVSDIQKEVCSYFGLQSEHLLSKTRKREIVQARQIAMYLSRSMTKTSLASIGSQIGGKDHATVLHACNTVCDLMDTDRQFRQYVVEIEKRLKR
ncbi:MAG: chromosomal replication initiator protein DnaA [Bacteroidales bacterium]|nr:chromosomal replication initiator protein DnaA [Bacteroidales bacterium]MCL2739056.1 chromosomal replication initiator protein DnaA [Bacteroidales bacterium]